MTSSWFYLSTLNYDARSTTHQIYSFNICETIPLYVFLILSISLNYIWSIHVWFTGLDPDISPDEQEEKARLISQVLELQNTLDGKCSVFHIYLVQSWHVLCCSRLASLFDVESISFLEISFRRPTILIGFHFKDSNHVDDGILL